MSCNRHYLNLHLRQFFPASVISTILHVLNSSPSYSYRSYQNLSSAEWNLNCIQEVYFHSGNFLLFIWNFGKGKFRKIW